MIVGGWSISKEFIARSLTVDDGAVDGGGRINGWSDSVSVASAAAADDNDDAR